MKKLKTQIREYLFQKLLLLIFKFSDTHKLIRFEKIPKGEHTYYKFEVRTVLGIQYEIEEHVEEYLKTESTKNNLKWENKGFYQRPTIKTYYKEYLGSKEIKVQFISKYDCQLPLKSYLNPQVVVKYCDEKELDETISIYLTNNKIVEVGRFITESGLLVIVIPTSVDKIPSYGNS